MRRRGHRSILVPAFALAISILTLSGCGGAGQPQTANAHDDWAQGVELHPRAPSAAPQVQVADLEQGESWIELGMPGGSYTPHATGRGTDDYRCLLLDPGLLTDVVVSGVVLQPGNADLVHHAILYRVDPAQVTAAEARDAADPDEGWSCFGGPNLPDPNGQLGGLNQAPWVAAFATTGGEQRFRPGTGMELAAGSRLVLQLHYNLLASRGGSDNSSIRLRVAPAGAALAPLHTMLLPAPVELACSPDESGPLCDREAAVLDVMGRFGPAAGRTVAGLQVLCGGSLTAPRSSTTQSCTRPVDERIRIQAVAGHMHLLGRSISIDLLRSDGSSTRLLDVPTFNFDDQRATQFAEPVTAHVGDRLRVTCTHDAGLRRLLPELRALPPRYVVWGDGTSDEMCLGIVTFTT